MKAIAIANFLVDFKRELVQFQGFISFALLAYWVGSLWRPLMQKLENSRLERFWFVFCLIFGLFIGFVSAVCWGSEYLLIALSLGLSIGLAMCHATIAVCLFTCLLFLRPWELMDSDDYFLILPKLTFGLCIAHVLLTLARKRRLSLTWSRVGTYLILFALWCFATTFKAGDPAAAQTAYFDTLFKGVFLYLMLTNVISEKADLRTVVGTLVLTFIGVGLVSIVQTLGLAQAQNGEEVRLIGIGAFANSNDIAALMVLSFPFSLMTALRRESSTASRAMALVGMAVGGYSIYLSQSRAAMLALAISLCLLAVLRVRNRLLTIGFCILALLAVPAYMAKSSRDSSDLSESSSSRITYFKTGLVMGAKNPVLGVGFNGYAANFERYATEILYEWGHRTAHNSWVLVFAETGLLGAVLFITLFIANLKNAWHIFGVDPEFLLSAVGYGVAMSFLSHSYLLYPYLLYGLTTAATQLEPSVGDLPGGRAA